MVIRFNNIEPRPYQKAILNELKCVPSIGLFMGTGTGKTLTSLMKVNQLDVENLLVLCPAKVVDQWLDTIKEHIDNANIIEFKKTWSAAKKESHILESLKDSGNIIVVSLESVARYTKLSSIIDMTWCVIVDESHKIKEIGTVRKPVKVTKRVLEIGNRTDFKIILTATPTQKDKGGYIDYFAQLKFLGYYQCSVDDFKNRYCIMDKIQPIGLPFPIKIIKNYKNTKEIDDLLRLCCRRYVAKLGDFEPQHYKISLDKPQIYNKVINEKYYKDLDLRNLSQRRICQKTLCTGTVKGVDIYHNSLEYEDNTIKYDWLLEFISNTDEKIIVFYKYNVELAQLKKLCEALNKSYIVIDGKNKQKKKDIDRDDYDIILGQFGACGESIDGIQFKTHICVYYAMPESSLEYRQALGRIDRVGQTKVPMYYYLVTKGTIEDNIYKMTQSKVEFNEKTLNKLILSVDN